MIHNFKAIKFVRGTAQEICAIEFQASSATEAMKLLLDKLTCSGCKYIVGKSGLVAWIEGSKYCWAISPGLDRYKPI